jgi:hypothetical protein
VRKYVIGVTIGPIRNGFDSSPMAWHGLVRRVPRSGIFTVHLAQEIRQASV